MELAQDIGLGNAPQTQKHFAQIQAAQPRLPKNAVHRSAVAKP
jgi:hypothetical protein